MHMFITCNKADVTAGSARQTLRITGRDSNSYGAPYLLEGDQDPSPDDGRTDEDTADGVDPPALLPERRDHGDDYGCGIAARARK